MVDSLFYNTSMRSRFPSRKTEPRGRFAFYRMPSGGGIRIVSRRPRWIAIPFSISAA